MHYASLSYKSYFDYDVVFVKDYKDEIINENMYYDLSPLFICSDIYINDIKTNNTMFFSNRSPPLLFDAGARHCFNNIRLGK